MMGYYDERLCFIKHLIKIYKYNIIVSQISGFNLINSNWSDILKHDMFKVRNSYQAIHQ